MAGQKSNNPSYLRVIDGFENGVRVAFAQIGRTTSFGMQNSEKEPDPDVNPQYYDLVKQVQGLNCNSGHTYYNKTGDVYDKRLSISGNPNLIANYSDTTGNTDVGICRVDNIWEPNDKVHTREALAYYKTSCKERIANGTIGDNTFLKSAYNTGRNCTNFTNGMQIPTYVINDEINVGDNGTPDTDIYDGLNGYNKTIGENKQLIKYNYFTDTDKMIPDDERKAFLYLASNSITKVRVYIYLEGQDIDNYYHGGIPKDSLDSKGQNYGLNGYQNSKIMMNFGFTKSRFDNN